MGNLFPITTPADDIKADAEGKASAVFTVTNTTGKPIRGVVKAKALGNTQQDWLDTEGELERDFGGNGTQQFTVNFKKPASVALAADEKFPFRFDIASTLNPDEQFTEGPTVNIEVKGKPTAPPPKTSFPLWLILAIAGGALLVIALVLFLVLQRGCNSGGGGGNTNNNSAPQVTNFEGVWRPDNADPNFTFVATAEIKQSGREVQIKIICRFIVCEDWGVGEGKVVGDSAVVEWKNAAVTGKVKITLLEPTRIMMDGSFEPKSGMLHPAVKAVLIKN